MFNVLLSFVFHALALFSLCLIFLLAISGIVFVRDNCGTFFALIASITFIVGIIKLMEGA
jgi:hypothetical protein